MLGNSYRIAMEIIGSPWMIDPGKAESLLPIVHQILQGTTAIKPVNPDALPKVEYYVSAQSRASYTPVGGDGMPSNQKVIAVIPIKDVITKYDVECGPRGTETISRWIQGALNDPNVTAIVLDIDSPGGAANATQQISQIIKEAGKPVIAYSGNGITASAAYWIASSANEIYATFDTDEIGSIGTYVTIADYKKYFEAQGLKLHEVYATRSTEKNLEFRKALDGDYELLKKNLLDPFNESFINTVKENRPGISEKVFTGKLFMAKDALKMGLIDGIKSFPEVLQRAMELSETGPQSQDNKNQKSDTMFGKNKLTIAALSAFALAKPEERTPEMLKAVNDELQANGIDGQLVATEEMAKLSGLQTALSQEQGAHQATKDLLTAANKEVGELKAIAPKKETPERKGEDQLSEDKTNDFSSPEDEMFAATRAKAGIK